MAALHLQNTTLEVADSDVQDYIVVGKSTQSISVETMIIITLRQHRYKTC
jgi:hypothetical protein